MGRGERHLRGARERPHTSTEDRWSRASEKNVVARIRAPPRRGARRSVGSDSPREEVCEAARGVGDRRAASDARAMRWPRGGAAARSTPVRRGAGHGGGLAARAPLARSSSDPCAIFRRVEGFETERRLQGVESSLTGITGLTGLTGISVGPLGRRRGRGRRRDGRVHARKRRPGASSGVGSSLDAERAPRPRRTIAARAKPCAADATRLQRARQHGLRQSAERLRKVFFFFALRNRVSP